MKKIIVTLLALALVLSLAACGSSNNAGTDAQTPAADTTITVGASSTPHAEILEQVTEALAAEGYTLKVVIYDDYVLPNQALSDGSLDANYFQHVPYLNSYNASNGTNLVSAAMIHYEPFGLYGNGVSAVADIADGATILIPADDSNETRALLLLQQEGLIKLADGIDASSNATIFDIAENPKDLKITEMDAAQLARSREDVDLAVINGNFALAAGLNAAEDALAIEDASGDAARTYANLLGVKAGHENDPAIQALVKALQSDAVRDYINDNYGGAVVPIF